MNTAPAYQPTLYNELCALPANDVVVRVPLFDAVDFPLGDLWA